MAEGWKWKGLVRGEGIPPPSGEYSVGCADILVDLEVDETPGGLLIRLYYPTKASSREYTYAPWFPNKRYIRGMLDFIKSKYSGLISTVLNTLTDPRIPALQGAPLLPAESSASAVEGEATAARPPPFPVIVFSHGQGAFRSFYSGILCDLASHGYVVASMDHRDGSACASLKRLAKRNGREGELEDHWVPYRRPPEGGEEKAAFKREQVKQRANDLVQALNFFFQLNEGSTITDLLGGRYDFSQFKGRLDVSKAAVVGHSFGGGSTIRVLTEEPRFMCGIGLDAEMLPVARDIQQATELEITQPLYLINCTHMFQTKENVQKMKPLCKPPNESGMTAHRLLTLNNTTHLSQTDLYFTIPKSFRGKIEESILNDIEAHQLSMDVCHAFLKRHLLQDPEFQGPVPNLDGCEGHSPHIIFGTNFDDEAGGSASSSESGGGAGGGAEGGGPGKVAEVVAGGSEEKQDDKKELVEGDKNGGGDDNEGNGDMEAVQKGEQ